MNSSCSIGAVVLKQVVFSVAGFDRYGKTTKREVFLSKMDQVSFGLHSVV